MTNTPDLDLVVLGLGYVGLPLAREAARAGLRVGGYDLDARRVERLNAGRSHVDDVSDEDLAGMLRGGFAATADPARVGRADVALICVPRRSGSTAVPTSRRWRRPRGRSATTSAPACSWCWSRRRTRGRPRRC